MTHYGIVGPGALGLLWAAKLSRQYPVSLWARPGAVSRSYEWSDTTGVSTSVSIAASNEPPDIVLLMTKSYDALSAIHGAVSRWSQTPKAILLFQNGIGSQDQIADAFPGTPVLAATTTEGANLRPDGSIIHAGRGITRLGQLNRLPEIAAEWAAILAADFVSAGFDTRAEAHIRSALWDKLLINAGINAFTVILDCPNGGLPGNAFFETHIGLLSDELSRISETQGYIRTAETIEARIRQIAGSTAENISSMLQDARAGRRTEIDYINGAVVAIARKNGIASPVNEVLWERVKGANENG